MEYIVANWQDLCREGVMVVSVVISLMSLLKAAVLKKIGNEILRKAVLSLVSLALVIPATWLSMKIQDMEFYSFWINYAVNAILTVLGYWAYRNFGCKDFVSWVGKKLLKKFPKLKIRFENRDYKEIPVNTYVPMAVAEARDYEPKLAQAKKSKYKEDDLKEV